MSMPAGTYYVGDLCYVMHPGMTSVTYSSPDMLDVMKANSTSKMVVASQSSTPHMATEHTPQTSPDKNSM
jgi:hypothetical protein